MRELLSIMPLGSSFDVIEGFRSLVEHDIASDVVRFAHWTVPLFLEDFYDKLDESVISLGAECISYLERCAFRYLCTSHSSMKARLQEHPFCCYAARHWALHVLLDKAEALLWERIIDLLDTENKRNSILQIAVYETG
jgi:hypothetical protein